MATDIVIQLRELASSIERGNGKSTVYGAADEIERLQKELDLWHKSAVELARQLGKEEYAEAEYINQKVRGK